MDHGMDIEQKIAELGIELGTPKPALASYVPYRFSGKDLYISGQGPVDASGAAICGCLGKNIELVDGQQAARLSAINILSQLRQALNGDWSRLIGCIKLNGFVAATPDFENHPAIINGASDLIKNVLGEKGQHARSAIGVSSLPLGWAVEIDALFEVKCDE